MSMSTLEPSPGHIRCRIVTRVGGGRVCKHRGLPRRSLCLPILRKGPGPSKRQACFFKGAAQMFSSLAPFIRAARLQNEITPEKCLNRCEEKNAKRIRKTIRNVYENCKPPRGPNDQKNSISLEIFNLAQIFQS